MSNQLFLSILFYFIIFVEKCDAESVNYISIERPNIAWFDTKYFKKVTIVCRRINRRDPRHYVDLFVHSLFTIANTLHLDFYFYQFLTNRYKPSFVEMHFRFCDMLKSDLFFGHAIQRALKQQTCPFPPGEYDLKNMSISYVPKDFPFAKGRIYHNLSIFEDGKTKQLASSSIDMEIKRARLT